MTESHIKATSLENNRRGGNRIGADLNRLETVRQECVCMCYSHIPAEPIWAAVALQVILNAIPTIQSTVSIISTCLSHLRWTENLSLMRSGKSVAIKMSALVCFIKWNASNESEHHKNCHMWSFSRHLVSFRHLVTFLFVLTVEPNLRYHLGNSSPKKRQFYHHLISPCCYKYLFLVWNMKKKSDNVQPLFSIR